MSKTPVQSDSQLARILGVDKALICRHKKRGMPTDSVESAVAWRQENLSASQRKDSNPARDWHKDRSEAPVGGPSDQPLAGVSQAADHAGSVGASGFQDHRVRREKAEADQAELRAKRAAGEVLLREPAERAIFDAFRGLRDSAFQAMRDAAPKVRDLSDVRQIQLTLEGELRQAFAAFETATRLRVAELAKGAKG